MTGFDPTQFFGSRIRHHGTSLGIVYHASGDAWAELALPYDPALAGDATTGTLASGPIVTLMDQAASLAVWIRRGAFLPHATLDLRIDYLRGAVPGRTVIGRGECYRLTKSVAFVRGQAHDGNPDDPIAHVAGTFMVTGMAKDFATGMARA